MTSQPQTPARLFLGYLVDIVAPTAVYAVLKLLGIPPGWGLALGIGVALSTTVANTIAHRRLDRVGVFVVIEIALSLLLIFVTDSPRILLAKPSVYTAAAGVYLLFTTFGRKPINYEAIRALAAKDGPARAAAFDYAWESSDSFRKALRTSALGWSVILLIDSAARLYVVYNYPLDRATWLSNVPHFVSIGLLAVFSALMGKKTSAMVDEQMRQTDLSHLSKAS